MISISASRRRCRPKMHDSEWGIVALLAAAEFLTVIVFLVKLKRYHMRRR